ncbi:hypothetical protein ACWKSP_09560 [Micromonosporaceae bacterium Da 78-11]
MSRADAGQTNSSPQTGRETGRAGSLAGAAEVGVLPADQAATDQVEVSQGAVDQGGRAAADGTQDIAAPRRVAWAGWDSTIRVAGVVISIVAAFVSGVFELLLTTMRAGDFVMVWRGDAIGSGGGPLIPVSILLAVVGNMAIAWFAVHTTRRRWALGPPWALWTLMMLAASGVRTAEGDYLLGGSNWVALVMVLVGSLSFAVYSYRMILKRVRP